MNNYETMIIMKREKRKIRNLFLVLCYSALFVLGASLFSKTDKIALADDCTALAEVSEYKPYDICKPWGFTEGVRACDNTRFHFQDNLRIWQDQEEYYYDGHNAFCIGYAATMFLNVTLAIAGMNAVCSLAGTDVASSLSQVRGIGVIKVAGKGVWSLTKAIIASGASAASHTTLSMAASVFVDPKIMVNVDLAAGAVQPTLTCGRLTIQAVATASPLTGAAAAACCTSIGAAVAEVQGVFAAYLGGVYREAKIAYDHTKVCGHDWYNFSLLESSESIYPIKGAFEGSYKKKVTDCITKEECSDITIGCEVDNCKEDCGSENCKEITPSSLDRRNRVYREYLYNGKEYVNRDIDGGCYDPRLPEYKGYNGREQRYYLRGSDAGNYACTRFYYTGQGCVAEDGTPYTKQDVVADPEIYRICKLVFEDAYKCCIARSSDSICIESSLHNKPGTDTIFCRRGFSTAEEEIFDATKHLCTLKGYMFEPYRSAKSPSGKMCIRSYSVCPYNFNVMGGSEKEMLCSDKKECKEGILKNACQLDAHCTVIPREPYLYSGKSLSRYTDPACKNFIGDSQNVFDVSIAKGKGVDFHHPGKDILHIILLHLLQSKTIDAEVKAKMEDLFAEETFQKTFENYLFEVSAESWKNAENELYNQIENYGENWYEDPFLLGENFTFLWNGIIDVITKNSEILVDWAEKTIPEVIPEAGEEVAIEIVNNWNNIEDGIVRLLSSYIWDTSIIDIGNYRGFTAPMAQCIKESVSNIFFNKAGISQCIDDETEVNSYGLCGDDTPDKINPDKYVYIIGQSFPESQNVFFRLQNRVRGTIRIVAALSIMVIAIYTLIKGDFGFVKGNEKLRVIGFYVLKFSLVFYFATTSAWQDYLYKELMNATYFGYNKVYNLASGGVHERVFDPVLLRMTETDGDCQNISEDAPLYEMQKCLQNKFDLAEHEVWSNKYDGCTFTMGQYPVNKSYLAIFDALDCKLSRYFGYGPQVNIPNIIIFLLSSFLVHWLGPVLLTVGFFFFFCMLSIVIKVLYIFTISFMAISILIFVSPLMFPLMLFKKTKGMFDGWFSNLMGFILQPMILMLFVAFYVSIFDQITLGDAKFRHGNSGRAPVLRCENDKGQTVTNGLLCIFNFDPAHHYRHMSNVLENIGVDLMILDFQSIGGHFIDMGLGLYIVLVSMLQFALIAYVFNQLLRQITGIAANLVGGAELAGGDVSPTEIAGKVYQYGKIARDVGKGVVRTGIKGVVKGIEKGAKVLDDERKKLVKGVRDAKKMKKTKKGKDTLGKDAVRDADEKPKVPTKGDKSKGFKKVSIPSASKKPKVPAKGDKTKGFKKVNVPSAPPVKPGS